jgi:DNA invertase Pin-like site-specific DNA recombinase
LDTAREEGRIGGRRPKLTKQQQSEIQKMVARGKKSAADAARLFKVHPATVSRIMARASLRKSSGTREELLRVVDVVMENWPATS